MSRPRSTPIEISPTGEPFFEATVKPQGNTGRIYPPKDWIGKQVRVTLIE